METFHHFVFEKREANLKHWTSGKMMSSSSQAKNGNIASNDSIEQTISNDECSSLLEHSHSNVSSSSHQHAHASSQRHISEKVPLYARPRQRQRWDETQILPHVNWGDLVSPKKER